MQSPAAAAVAGLLASHEGMPKVFPGTWYRGGCCGGSATPASTDPRYVRSAANSPCTISSSLTNSSRILRCRCFGVRRRVGLSPPGVKIGYMDDTWPIVVVIKPCFDCCKPYRRVSSYSFTRAFCKTSSWSSSLAASGSCVRSALARDDAASAARDALVLSCKSANARRICSRSVLSRCKSFG